MPTFNSKYSVTEILEIDLSQIIWIQVFGKFFHLKKIKFKKLANRNDFPMKISWFFSSKNLNMEEMGKTV